MIIHPSFDPEAKLWFYEHQGKILEGASIPELLKKFRRGARVTVQDYFVRTAMPAPASPSIHWSPKPPDERPAIKHKIVALGFRGMGAGQPVPPTLPEIAPPPPPPPAPPQPRPGGYVGRPDDRRYWSKDQYETALELWAQAVPGDRICKQLGLRPAHLSHIMESARKWGDPRAVRRTGKGGRSRLPRHQPGGEAMNSSSV